MLRNIQYIVPPSSPSSHPRHNSAWNSQPRLIGDLYSIYKQKRAISSATPSRLRVPEHLLPTRIGEITEVYNRLGQTTGQIKHTNQSMNLLRYERSKLLSCYSTAVAKLRNFALCTHRFPSKILTSFRLGYSSTSPFCGCAPMGGWWARSHLGTVIVVAVVLVRAVLVRRTAGIQQRGVVDVRLTHEDRLTKIGYTGIIFVRGVVSS